MMYFDCFAMSEQGGDLDGNDDYVIVDSYNGMFIVADGMGGRPGGARASKIAAKTLRDEVLSMKPSARLDEVSLRNAAAAANAAVRAVSESNPTLQGMGTTLTAAVFSGMDGKIVHVGDSRVYRFAEGRMESLTQDHTLVAELVARNHLSKEGARRFPLRNVLSRTIGTVENVRSDIHDLVVAADEWLLLVTDGLYHVLTDENLGIIIAATEEQGAEAVCYAIMNAALGAEPEDNLTVAVIRPCEVQIDR